MKPLLPSLLCSLLLAAVTSARAAATAEFWLDLVEGEEASEQHVIDDLATAGVVYVGEAHTIARHHALQLHLLQQLAARGLPLVLCLEQLEARTQPVLDRYNRGEIDYDTLVRESDWAKKWKNYLDYRALCEFAHANQIPLRALNAPAEVIRAVSRGGGLAKLPSEQRATLPTEIDTDDPAYERMMNHQLAVHMAMDPVKLRPVFEAQVSRDETMAANIVAGRRDGAADKPRTAFVIIGSGHVRYGQGTASRVRRRDPGIIERIVLMTESGQLELSASDKAATREISITHADLREVARPPGDYLNVLPLEAAAPAAKAP
ncbi:MAG: ChaN family lipoprotein [Opitutae bacterium]|nr:ChaN family lipoprotein [Opitutae bacterium]